MDVAPYKYDSKLSGDRLRGLRTELEKTQEDVARDFHLSRTAIPKIEKGSREIKVSELYDFAKYYGTTADYILGLTNVTRAGDTLPSCDQLGLSDTAVCELEYLKDQGLYGRIISKMLEHDYFKHFLFYAEKIVLSDSIDCRNPDCDINALTSSAKKAGYVLIAGVEEKSYYTYMASRIMEIILLAISETIFPFDSNADCD